MVQDFVVVRKDSPRIGNPITMTSRVELDLTKNIVNILPGNEPVTIRGQCTKKSDLKKFTNKITGGDSVAFNFDLTDMSGTMTIISYDSFAHKFFNIVEVCNEITVFFFV